MSQYNEGVQGVVTDKRSNGQGYWRYEPDHPENAADLLPITLSDRPSRFVALGHVIDASLHDSSLLLEGAPGTGKSNILNDISALCVEHGIPAVRIALHINAGNMRHVEETLDLLNTFCDGAAEDSGGIVMLDNVDYVGYRGKRSRSRASARDYALDVVPIFIKTVTAPEVTTIGTSHTDAWRNNKWTWHDPLIDRPARVFKDSFACVLAFDGELTSEGLRTTVEDRGLDSDVTENIIRTLTEKGLKSFTYANHINPKTFMIDPDTAVAEVEAGQRSRNGDV